MEGIQHRLDCPARLRSDPADIEVIGQEFLDPIFVRTHTRCRECGRSALVMKRQVARPVGEQP